MRDARSWRQQDPVWLTEPVCARRIGGIPKQKPRITGETSIRGVTSYARAKTKDGEMVDFVDGTAFNNEQGNRARKLFAAVVLAALDDAIADDKKYGNGPEQIARW